MKQTSFIAIVLFTVGCGFDPLPSEVECDGDTDCVTIQLDETEPVSTEPAPTAAQLDLGEPIFVDLPPPPANDTTNDIDTMPDLSMFDLTNTPAFLGAYFDSRLVDLLTPAPLGSSFTHLERLCIENGIEEFICRQRYGY